MGFGGFDYFFSNQLLCQRSAIYTGKPSRTIFLFVYSPRLICKFIFICFLFLFLQKRTRSVFEAAKPGDYLPKHGASDMDSSCDSLSSMIIKSLENIVRGTGDIEDMWSVGLGLVSTACFGPSGLW